MSPSLQLFPFDKLFLLFGEVPNIFMPMLYGLHEGSFKSHLAICVHHGHCLVIPSFIHCHKILYKFRLPVFVLSHCIHQQ